MFDFNTISNPYSYLALFVPKTTVRHGLYLKMKVHRVGLNIHRV